MQKQETLSYEEQYKDQSVNFTPHALWGTGIVTSQSLLKVDTFNLACIPYQFGMQRAILLCALSRDEIQFFQRFKGGLAGLGLSFQRPGERNPMKVFCRCNVESIGPLKGRDQLALIVLVWKPIPPDLAQILGEYLLGLERLKLQYGDYHDRMVAVTPESARKLGYNNYAVFTIGATEPMKLALFSIGAAGLSFLLPLRSSDLAPGSAGIFSLFFQRYRFSVKGKIEATERLPSGVQKAKASLDFSPELVQLLEEYFFTERHPSPKEPGQDGRS